jgi:hypothetical protein
MQEPAMQEPTVDLGAPWAGTMPMRGVDIEFDWARSAVTALPRSACAPLAASVHRHTIWFAGPEEPFEKDASAYLPSLGVEGRGYVEGCV